MRATEGLTHSDLRSELERIISGLEKPGKDEYLWVRDVTTDGEVIYQLRDSSGETHLWQRSYSVDENDEVSVGDERAAVKRRTDYVPAVEMREQLPEGEAFAEATVDAEAGIIRNVKALGKVSANGRVYSEQAMRDAVRLYDGTKVYLDHPTDREARERKGVRSVRDLVGEARSPRLGKNGADVRVDLHLLDPTSVEGRKVLAVATRMPRAMGSSHRAWGPIKRGEDGTDVVEGLERVASLDLVSDPATTSGLYESIEDDEPPQEGDVDKLTIEQLKKNHPELVEQVLAEAKGTERVAQLEEENKRLRKWKDDREAEDRVRERNEYITQAIARAKLPEHAITEPFRAMLVEAKDTETVDELVADRAKVVEAARKAVPGGKPRSTESDPEGVVESSEGGKRRDRPFGDEEFAQLAESAFVGGVTQPV